MTTAGRVDDPAGALERGAQVLRIPPPLYYGVAFAAGMVMRSLTVPLAIGGGPATAIAGGAVFVAGTGLALAGVAAVVRNRTTIVPHHEVSTLVTTAVYRLSRNPMYAGLVIAYLGGALLAGSWWPVLTLPLAVVAVRRIVIAPEERYLAARFGQTYADYSRRTRRWL